MVIEIEDAKEKMRAREVDDAADESALFRDAKEYQVNSEYVPVKIVEHMKTLSEENQKLKAMLYKRVYKFDGEAGTTQLVQCECCDGFRALLARWESPVTNREIRNFHHVWECNALHESETKLALESFISSRSHKDPKSE